MDAMMLTVYIHNIETNTDETCNYEYAVRVNDKTIQTGKVSGHKRADGWGALLKLVAEEAPQIKPS